MPVRAAESPGGRGDVPRTRAALLPGVPILRGQTLGSASPLGVGSRWGPAPPSPGEAPDGLGPEEQS